jgi:hypothetical protein
MFDVRVKAAFIVDRHTPGLIDFLGTSLTYNAGGSWHSQPDRRSACE